MKKWLIGGIVGGLFGLLVVLLHASKIFGTGSDKISLAVFPLFILTTAFTYYLTINLSTFIISGVILYFIIGIILGKVYDIIYQKDESKAKIILIVLGIIMLFLLFYRVNFAIF